VVGTVASLELLHACALIHDDVMDGSDTRRGQPAVHRRFASMHRTEAWHGDPTPSARRAILLGDMCLSGPTNAAPAACRRRVGAAATSSTRCAPS
jgi:geranylgeranyl diphosphate synthase type I